MKKLVFNAIMFMLLSIAFVSCSKDSDNEKFDTKVETLPTLDDISLNYHSASKNVTLGRNVESEGAIVKLKNGVSWINGLRLSGNTVSFNVEENNNTSTGHRFDTIIVSVKSQRIGTICVTQARNPISVSRLEWANSSALYKNKALSAADLSGLEMTKMVYNLEKTTNGKDSYKNYPAFAFCIEMNHDPEHKMEWYLPSEDEIRSYAHSQSYSGTPIANHNYWWSSSENHINGTAYNVYSGSTASRGAVSKSGDWWVVAFRNGKIEE